jgi:hypothetical protein
MRKLHLTIGDKGGIGKSFIAALMTQYIRDNVVDVKPVCIDMDMKNRTFSRYSDLGVELIDVRTEGDIDRSKFDILINRIDEAGDDDVIIVDVGGNIYISMTDYMRVNEVYEMIAARGVEIILHVPIVGGGDMFPTLKTLDEVVVNTPPNVLISVWINQKNGRVEYEGKSFEESTRYEEYRSRIRCVTHIPLWRPDMQVNVAAMLEEAVTFDQALDMGMFDLMSRQRLTMAKRYLYDAIQKSGVMQ